MFFPPGSLHQHKPAPRRAAMSQKTTADLHDTLIILVGTHQQHQHAHFRLSHPTPVAVPRSHDAVATSGYAGAIGCPPILGHRARRLGKCSSLRKTPRGGGVAPATQTHTHSFCVISVSSSLHDFVFISIMQPHCETIHYTRG